MNKEIVLCGLLLVTSKGYSQLSFNNFDRGYYVSLSELVSIENVKFHVYKPILVLSKDDSFNGDTKCVFPEQLMQSFISADNQIWESKLFDIEMEKFQRHNEEYYDRKKKQDRSKNFFELRCKITYRFEGKLYCHFKYYIHDENLKIPECWTIQLVKENDKWIGTLGGIQFISRLLRDFDEDKLEKIFLAENTDDEILNNLIKSVKTQKGIDVKRLSEISNKWVNEKDKNMMNHFFDKNSWEILNLK